MKLDIRKYFDSVSHQQLVARLQRRFKDARLLQLLERIIGSFRGETQRGLPIGSLTSQHFANFYLGWFDRLVKEHWRVTGYVRYMDDMIVWGDSRSALRELWCESQRFLYDELELHLNPVPHLNRSHQGIDFLGCRVYRDHLTLNRRSRTRFRRQLLTLEDAFLRGSIGALQLQQRATALVAFTRTPELASGMGTGTFGVASAARWARVKN